MLEETEAKTVRRSAVVKVREFDDVLQEVGMFGRYQKLRIALFFLPVSFFLGLASTSIYFELVVPPHWCHVPGRENTSLSPQEWINITIPPSEVGSSVPSSCEMFRGVWETHNGTLTYTHTNETMACQYGWEFDQSEFVETDATLHEFVCEDETHAHHSISVNLAGRAVGTLLLPMLADNYLGKRRTFFLAVLTYVVFTLPLLWVSSPTLKYVFRFLQALGFETNYLMPYVIMMEIIPPNRRDVTMMLTFVSWSSGMTTMALVGWLGAHWKIIQITTLLPLIASFAYWRALPESPRWLLSKGRLRECADILLQIGASNGASTISRQVLQEDLHALTLRMPPNEPLTKAFVFPKLRLRASMLFLLAFTQYIVYGVIVLSMTIMPGNYFMSHLVLTLFELPSLFVGLVVMHYFGRRFLGYSSLLLGAVCYIVCPFVMESRWLLLGVLAVAKLSVTCTLFLVFLLPTEILPTPVRTSGGGLAVVSGMLGMTLSPLLLYNKIGDTFHYWVLLGITFLSMLTLTPLPETLGTLMPQTFQDAEVLGTDRPLHRWIHYWNVHKYTHTRKHAGDDVNVEEEEKDEFI